MYGQLPFDQPETIQKLGERLFTRIKDEEAQAVIRAFLRQSQAKADDVDAVCVSTARPSRPRTVPRRSGACR
jgi:hypothetical protein